MEDIGDTWQREGCTLFSRAQKQNPAGGIFRRGSGHKSLTMTYFHRRTSTIIGAKAFHCPVRDGKEWDHLAMVVKRDGLRCVRCARAPRAGFSRRAAGAVHSANLVEAQHTGGRGDRSSPRPVSSDTGHARVTAWATRRTFSHTVFFREHHDLPSKPPCSGLQPSGL